MEKKFKSFQKTPKRVDICYDIEPAELYQENKELADADFKRLVSEGYPSVQIVLSNHPYSEGLWVEANSKPNPHSPLDTVLKSHLS